MGGDLKTVLHGDLDKWPPSKTNASSSAVKYLMEKFNLIWRAFHPHDCLFAWNNISLTRLSRIDFWLISNTVNKEDLTVNIFLLLLLNIKPLNWFLHFQARNKLFVDHHTGKRTVLYCNMKRSLQSSQCCSSSIDLKPMQMLVIGLIGNFWKSNLAKILEKILL